WALRGGASGEDAVAQFPDHVDQVVAMMSPEGVAIDVAGRAHRLHATPHADSVPQLWLLGSSAYSARLAASRGLPYVFAHHFSGIGTAETIAWYRENYRPSQAYPEPRTFVTVNAVVAATAQEARRLAVPNIVSMLALRTGATLGRQLLVEEAEARGFTATEESLLGDLVAPWIVDAPAAAAQRVRELAEAHGVDEVMVQPVAGATSQTPAAQSPGRVQTLELLAAALADSAAAHRRVGTSRA
ncbi:MAG: LLM class flavin-dependent oxidoreductase, partial [Arachnia sp.]